MDLGKAYYLIGRCCCSLNEAAKALDMCDGDLDLAALALGDKRALEGLARCSAVGCTRVLLPRRRALCQECEMVRGKF